MNHPTREELLDFFEQELPAERQALIAAHAADCEECGEQLGAWHSARAGLAAWELSETEPAARRRSASRGASRGGWRRPVAAVALVAAGFALALVLAPRWDASGQRAELAQETQRHVQEQFRAELANFESKQQAHREELLAALNGRLDQLELQWLVEYADLRRDIETVAIGTQEGLRRLAGGELSVEDTP